MPDRTATYADAGTAQFTGHYGPGTLGVRLARPAGAPAESGDVATSCSTCGQPIRYGSEAFMRLGHDERAAPVAAILCRRCGGGK